MYNNCPDGVEPNWEPYDALEISPVAEYIEDGDITIEPCDELHKAVCWSVYGHLKGGGVECITDVSTEKLALAVAGKIAIKTGFQINLFY